MIPLHQAISHSELLERCMASVEVRPLLVSPHWRAESFRATPGEAMTIRRAKALNTVLERCDRSIIPGELLVGLGSFERMALSDSVSREILSKDVEYLSFIGSRSFATHSDHHAPNYPDLLALGFGGLRKRTVASFEKHSTAAQKDFLNSVIIALDGASRYMRSWSEVVKRAAEKESAELLLKLSEMMAWLTENPPRTFWEALQLVYSYHSMMQIDDRYAMAFGRLDQFLLPFYLRDMDSGIETRETIEILLDHFFAKITISGDVQNIAVGGVLPEDGSDATNDLSFMILEACKRVGRPGGNITARIHSGTPRAFLVKCAEVIRTGIGYPAVFNDEVEIPALMDQGYPLKEARDYCFVGCIEVFIPGRMAPWSDSRFNLLHCVNLAVHNGRDSLLNRQIGQETGDPEKWEGFYDAFLVQMKEQLSWQVKFLNDIKQPFEDRAPDFTSPLMSALVDDCIERGRDLNDRGARYPGNHGVAGMGIATTADSLMAIKRFVYEDRRLSLEQLRQILDANYEGYESERQLLLKGAPKYGNDNDEVDAIAVRVTADFAAELSKYRTPQGGYYWGLMAANVSNIPAGKEVGATPDGRFALQPVSDAASPTFGRDALGPTAAIRSIAKLPYRLCPGGNVINMKFHPSFLEGEEGLNALASLIRTCFDLGGIQLQFNTVDRETLKVAMERPEEYHSLVVRVSGFSAHFVHLGREVQEDILSRTEHGKEISHKKAQKTQKSKN